MKIFLLLILFVMSCYSPVLAQEESSSFGVDIHGYVRADYFLDTRQVVSAREGHLLLYPTPEVLDPNGDDINATPSFNMLAIQTRMSAKITGPDALGAKTSGYIEGEFFGMSDNDVNQFRLRHAFVKLSWEKTALMFGQYWHPLFQTDCFPGTVSFNTGVPFIPFQRSPQVRLIQNFDNIELQLALVAQRDFTHTGPQGPTSMYLRNAGVPKLDAVLKFKSKTAMIGAGVEYNMIKPRLETVNGYKTDETVNAMVLTGFGKLDFDKFSFETQATYGQNVYDLLMIGGYAVSSTEAVTGVEEYTSYKTLSAWADLDFKGKLNGGLFVGFTKNLGTDDPITGTTYARGTNIDMVYRVSPRIQYKAGQTTFGCELEYTAATYGTANEKGEVDTNTETYGNARVIFAVTYAF